MFSNEREPGSADLTLPAPSSVHFSSNHTPSRVSLWGDGIFSISSWPPPFVSSTSLKFLSRKRARKIATHFLLPRTTLSTNSTRSVTAHCLPQEMQHPYFQHSHGHPVPDLTLQTHSVPFDIYLEGKSFPGRGKSMNTTASMILSLKLFLFFWRLNLI